jgi:hypothetical protein
LLGIETEGGIMFNDAIKLTPHEAKAVRLVARLLYRVGCLDGNRDRILQSVRSDLIYHIFTYIFSKTLKDY